MGIAGDDKDLYGGGSPGASMAKNDDGQGQGGPGYVHDRGHPQLGRMTDNDNGQGRPQQRMSAHV